LITDSGGVNLRIFIPKYAYITASTGFIKLKKAKKIYEKG
jgi:hypothetical protein